MIKAELITIMRKHCIVSCEIEDAIYFVQDLLECQANELKKTEPYAVNSIRRLEEAAREVCGLIDYIEEAMEE